MFWLDSHWCGQETFGFESQCPLLFEIETIRNSGQEYFILIDDARLFMAPPPAPNKMEEWPTVDQVCSHLKQLGNAPYVVVLEDVFIAVPGFAQSVVANFCQQRNSEWWHNFKPRPKGIRGGIRQIVDGIGTLSSGLAAMLR